MAIRIGNLVASTGFGILAVCAPVHAILMTTAPETELFSLATTPRTFHVSNDGKSPAVVVNDNNGPTFVSQLLNFDKFNTGLGTLQGVTISFTSDYASGATLSVIRGISEDGSSIHFFANGIINLLLTGPGLIADQTADKLVNANCSALSEASCSNSGSNNGSANGSTSGLPLAAFFGPGTFDLTAKLSAALTPKIDPDNGTGFADNATMDGTLNGSWNGTVSVVYTYDAPAGTAPEPITLYLLIAGLGGVALLRRRRT